jgi:type III secretion system OrgA/MxiK family protein
MMPALLRVMYAPLDYIHPDYFPTPECEITPALQQAVNHTLIKRFELTTALDFSLKSSDFSQRLVADWHLAQRAAWLLGCKMARGSLAKTGRLATLPQLARRFIELPIACNPVELAGAITDARLEAHGARYLIQLQQQLPQALAQRLPLLFSRDESGPLQGMALDRSLLTFAFDYAKNTYH